MVEKEERFWRESHFKLIVSLVAVVVAMMMIVMVVMMILKKGTQHSSLMISVSKYFRLKARKKQLKVFYR